MRDLPWREFKTTAHIEVYRVKCPECGVRIEKVPLLPSKAPFSKRFEDAVGQGCESAAARQVALLFGLPASMVRAIESAIPGAVGGQPTETGVGANGCRRDPLGKEAEVHHGGE